MPVIACSAMTGEGIKEALEDFINLVPKATDHEDYDAVNDKMRI